MLDNDRNKTEKQSVQNIIHRPISTFPIFALLVAIIPTVLVIGVWFLIDLSLQSPTKKGLGEAVGEAYFLLLLNVTAMSAAIIAVILGLIYTIKNHRNDWYYYVAISVLPVAAIGYTAFSPLTTHARKAQYKANEPICQQIEQMSTQWKRIASVDLSNENSAAVSKNGADLSQYKQLSTQIGADIDALHASTHTGTNGICTNKKIQAETIATIEATEKKMSQLLERKKSIDAIVSKLNTISKLDQIIALEQSGKTNTAIVIANGLKMNGYSPSRECSTPLKKCSITWKVEGESGTRSTSQVAASLRATLQQ